MTRLDDDARMMLQILALDHTACLRFSDYTGQWYIEASVEETDGSCITTICEHRPSPSEAVQAFYNKLCAIGSNRVGDHVLVTNAHGSDRRHWRFNGAAFAEISEYSLPWR